MFTFSQWLDDLLAKGHGHKYIKRIPYQSGGKLRYRYIYKVTHTHQGKHVLDPDHMKVGTKLMLDPSKGKEIHAHIVSVNGDQVIFEYDDGPHKGKLSRPMSKQALAEMLDKTHGVSDKLSAEREKQAGIVAKLKERGASEKQIAREQRRLEALGGGGDTPPAQEGGAPSAKVREGDRDRALDKYAQEIASDLEIEYYFRVSKKAGKILGLKKDRDGGRLVADIPYLENISREQSKKLAQALVEERPATGEITPIVKEWLKGVADEESKRQIDRANQVADRKYLFRESQAALRTDGVYSLDGKPKDPRLVTLYELTGLLDPVIRRRSLLETPTRSSSSNLELFRNVPSNIISLIDQNRVKTHLSHYGIAELANALGAQHNSMAQVRQNEQQIRDTIMAHLNPMLDVTIGHIADRGEAQDAMDSTIKTLEQIQGRAEAMARQPFKLSPTQRAMVEMSADPLATEAAYKDVWRKNRVDFNTERAKTARETLVEYKREADKILGDTSADVDWAGVVRRFRSFNEGKGGRPHVKQINKWASEIRDALIEQKLKERGLK